MIDACLLIAKCRGADPPFQQQHTDQFFELVQKHNLKILAVKKALDEISSKYNALMPSVNEFLQKLESAGKFELIENKVFQQRIPQIQQLRQEAKSNGFDLSFCDSLQIFYAKEKDMALISWDGGIIDYCEIKGLIALRPNEFNEEYAQKYS